MVVGFCGRTKDNIETPRLTALGLLMREVTSPRTVLSCSWTPSDVEGTVREIMIGGSKRGSGENKRGDCMRGSG
jgi:hypothetical protein